MVASPIPRVFSLLPLFLALSLARGSSAHISHYVTSGVSFNPTVAASEVPRQTSNVYQLVLQPLDTVVAPWGANTSNINGKDEHSGVRRLAINDEKSFPKSHHTDTSKVIQYSSCKLNQSDDLYSSAYPLIANDGETLNLGPNSILDNAGYTASLSSWQTLTVPFGFNLGQRGEFNGSLVLGGGGPGYDANRVQSLPWYILPGSENGTFLKNGTVNFPNKVTIQKYKNHGVAAGNPQKFDARINFNSDNIIFPEAQGAGLCQSNFSIILNVTAASTGRSTELGIPVSAFPSGEKSRCTTADTNDLELGLPFFSLTYILVSSLSSPLYLTLPNKYNLDPSPAIFSPHQTLVAPPSPPALPPAAASTAAATSLRGRPGLFHIICAFLMISLL